MTDTLVKDMQTLSDKVAQLEPKRLYKTIKPAIKSEMAKVAKKVANQAIASTLNVDLAEFRLRSVRGRVNDDLLGGFVTLKAGNQYMGKQGQYRTRHGTYGLKGIGKRKRKLYYKERYKPIAMWASDGTRMRRTKDGKPRGRMDNYRFFSNGEILMYNADKNIEAAIDKRIKKLGL